MAEILGKRLLGEVEVVGIREILNALRLQHDTLSSPSPFGFPPLDRILQASHEGRVHPEKTTSVIELISLHSGGGATHLVYHLAAIAVLPTEYGGRQSCAMIFDTDSHFDVDRLAAQIRIALDENNDSGSSESPDDTILQALRHVHVFRPQSLASLTATLDTLPSYLFNQQRHFSFERAVGFIAVDSASAFYWQDRAETEDAAFYAKTSLEPALAAPASGYAAFTAALKNACATLQCAAIFTSHYLGPTSTTPHGARSYRPSLPPPLAILPTLRLACQRTPVKKFPPLISLEGALREADDRITAVEEGKFECFVNEWGVDERTLRRIQGVGNGFEFQIRDEGLRVSTQ